jgi:1-acyl-sn-glycerol-3-phosphate acyltransferase
MLTLGQMVIACASIWTVLGILAVLWVALAMISPWMLRNPRENVETAFVWLFMRLYVRLVHRLSVIGREFMPSVRRPGPLIVVANHTAGVDPLLIQAAGSGSGSSASIGRGRAAT